MFAPLMNCLAATANEGLLRTVGWILLGVIVIGFLALGIRDIAKLSWMRISAISSVSFDESIRRRVLWITPLAIVGAIAVSQLQIALDPQDAIRQTTKICLFATGLVVTLVAIILASTNLQKEIETRVIYTIVTKPTTRLEIVLGKVWGFAKVSAAILLIMGVFTYAYLQVRARMLHSGIENRLASLPKDDVVSRPTLEHYREAGLLNANAMSVSESLQMLSRPPVDGQTKWMAGGQGQQFKLQFRVSDDQTNAIADAIKTGGGLGIVITMPVTVREPTPGELETIRTTRVPTEAGASDPAATQAATAPATTAPTTSASTTTAPTTSPASVRPLPTLGLVFMTPRGDFMDVPAEHVNNGKPVILPSDGSPLIVPLGGPAIEKIFENEEFTLAIAANSPAVEYEVSQSPIAFQLFQSSGAPGQRFEPLNKSPEITSNIGRYGQQLMGGAEGVGGVAVYRFNGVNLDRIAGESLTFEVKVGIEHGGEGINDIDTLPEVQLRVRNPESGAVSEARTFRPETHRITYVTLPKGPFGDNFEVLLRVLTPDQSIGLQPESVSLVTASRSFPVNLFKSLLVLWLLSILVVTIAIFCSTFVSWPIAIVLTLVILLGRWGVEQVGDAGGQGIGSVMTGQTEDAIKARLVRTSVDALAKVLAVVSAFLPDISGFQATADIERGISVPMSRLLGAGWGFLSYGLPMVMLAYLILRRKEVAP